MQIKQRTYENITLDTDKIDLEEYVGSPEHFVYFISSKPIDIKGNKKTLSIYADISFKEREGTEKPNNTSETENDQQQEEKLQDDDDLPINLEAPKRSRAISYSSGSDNIFFNYDESKSCDKELTEGEPNAPTNDREHFDSLTVDVIVSFYVNLEGVMYRIKDEFISISHNEFSPLFSVFKDKHCIKQDQLMNLVKQDIEMKAINLDLDELKDIFNEGNIDLTLDEIHENKNMCTINKVSLQQDGFIMVLINRYKGNQTLYYATKDDINKDFWNCINILTSSNVELSDLKNSFVLQSTQD